MSRLQGGDRQTQFSDVLHRLEVVHQSVDHAGQVGKACLEMPKSSLDSNNAFAAAVNDAGNEVEQFLGMLEFTTMEPAALTNDEYKKCCALWEFCKQLGDGPKGRYKAYSALRLTEVRKLRFSLDGLYASSRQRTVDLQTCFAPLATFMSLVAARSHAIAREYAEGNAWTPEDLDPPHGAEADAALPPQDRKRGAVRRFGDWLRGTPKPKNEAPEGQTPSFS